MTRRRVSDKTTMNGRFKTIRTTFWLNHVPVLLFAVVILSITGGVIWWLNSTTYHMAVLHAEGQLPPEAIETLGTNLTMVWMACLTMFMIAAMGGAMVAHRSSTRLVQRLDDTVRYVASVQADESPVTPEITTRDELGLLEQALVDLGQHLADQHRNTRAEAESREFDRQTHAAMKMARDETEVLEVVRRACHFIDDQLKMELLLADSSHAHLRRAVCSDEAQQMRPCVACSPADCPAAVAGHTRKYPTSSALDACPRLKETIEQPCSAVCIPISAAGKTVGVLHTRGEDQELLSNIALARLETVVESVGARLGLVRTLAATELAATTDPLTGLVNRRAMENAVRSIASSRRDYVLVMGDIDHFKKLNDRHGHDTGDRALRAFSRLVKSSLRQTDIACRYGGEEFCLILPDCKLDQAVTIIERLREQVPHLGPSYNIPTFTATFGVIYADLGTALDGAITSADALLYQGKEAGRNCTVVAGRGVVQPAEATTSLKALPSN